VPSAQASRYRAWPPVQYCNVTVESRATPESPPTKDLHQLSCADLDQRPTAGAGAQSWENGRVAAVDKVTTCLVRLLQAHEIMCTRHRLRYLPRPRDQMPLMYAQNTLQMEWCLDCHRNPAKNLRPPARFTTWVERIRQRTVRCGARGR